MISTVHKDTEIIMWSSRMIYSVVAGDKYIPVMRLSLSRVLPLTFLIRC